LGALVGIYYKHSIWDQLDEKGKYQNRQHMPLIIS